MYREIIFQWKDNHVSLNQWYSGKHWTTRVKLKDKWMAFYEGLFNQYDKFCFDTFQIKVSHNTRLDIDNMIPTCKLCADFMKENGWCIEDDKRYFKKLIIEVDDELPKNGIKVVISGYETI
jgi:Holliday junction resolvase RusA-like endonuclease